VDNFNIYIKINTLKIVIKGYYQFLLESVLFTSGYFEEILKKIDDKIAQDFLELVNKDIKTQYNAIDLSDTNDRLHFVSDNQFQNKIKSGINPLDLFSDKNNKTNISRIIRQILKDNGKEYTDAELSKFVDKFKAAYNTLKAKKEKKDPIRLVKGEDIRFWYLGDNYCEKTSSGYGTLGKSCMRYEECQKYLDIYVENPSVCNLLILTKFEDGEEKLVSRALLWQTDKGPYLDRIYYTDSSEEEMMLNWVKEKNCELSFKKYSGRLIVQLESDTKEYKYYPYMDTMPYYYTVNKKLYNYEPSVDVKRELLYCQDTGGGFDRQNLVYCEWIDESYPEEEVIWSEYHQSHLPMNNCCWSEYHNSEICDGDSVYSETLSDNLPKDDSVEVYISSRDTDWFPKDHDLIAEDEMDGSWYLKSLMKEINGRWYHKDYVKCVYEVKKSDISRYKEIFSIDDDVENEDCIATSDLIKFYQLSIKDDSTQFILIDDYYKKVYMNVHYVEMLKSLEEKESSDDVIEELESANFRLKDSQNFYSNNNTIIDNGGFSNALKIFNDSLDIKVKGNNTIFDLAFLSAENIYRNHVQSNLLKVQIKKIFENSLIEFCEGVSEYNTKYPSFDKDRLSKFIKMFEIVFPEYNDEDEINYYLQMTSATLEYSFRLIYNEIKGKEFSIIQALRYFTKNPNKLPVE